MTGALPSKAEDKAARTTRAANEILDRERQASDAKVARLRALRLSSEPEAPAKAPSPPAPTVRRKTAASLRTLALQGGMPVKAPAGKTPAKKKPAKSRAAVGKKPAAGKQG